MSGRQQDKRRMAPGRRAVAIAAVVGAVMIATAGSALASHHASATGPSAAAGVGGAWKSSGPPAGRPDTAAGWAPVAYRNARLSVPGSWLVESPQELSCGITKPGGMIFAGVRPGIPKVYGCGLAASLAWMLPAGHIPPGLRYQRPAAVIHGIPVYRRPSAAGSVLYLVPDLGVRVGARGPLARRVLATLTRSPLSVVLGRGPASPVPASWTWQRFGGVTFAVPSSWSPQREHQWATCGTGLEPGSLLLIDATRPPLYLPCPLSLPTAAAEQAQPGLTVVTGKYAAKSVGEKYVSCRVRHGVRLCLSSVTGQGGSLSGVLIFSVSQPGQPAAAYFLLGLPGSGTDARAVFTSIGMTSH